jgi:hypothetical protein
MLVSNSSFRRCKIGAGKKPKDTDQSIYNFFGQVTSFHDDRYHAAKVSGRDWIQESR